VKDTPEPCKRCAAGPTGVAGHERLVLLPRDKHAVPPPLFILRCRDCGTHWQRQFAPGSGVLWLRTAAARRAKAERNK
jgi:hypothetical protein